MTDGDLIFICSNVKVLSLYFNEWKKKSATWYNNDEIRKKINEKNIKK